MQSNGFDRNLKKKKFNPKGGPFGLEKTVFAAQGGKFGKKNSAFLEVSQICLRMA